MQAILNDRVQIAKAVNATVITLDEAPQGYQDFDSGVAKKFVLDPHGLIDGRVPQLAGKTGSTPPGPLLASAA